MVSSNLRGTPRITAGAFLLAGVAPFVASSQPVFERVASVAQQRQIVEQIETIQTQDGPYSEDLIGPLTALALSYEEGGDRGLAALAIGRARQAVRANYGLYSLEQAPLIRQSIRNEQARGNVEEAWDLEKELLALAERHPEDLRTVPILRDIGDARMALLQRYLAGEYPPEIILGCFYGRSDSDFGSCTSGSRGTVIRSIVWEAQSNYARAINVMLRHKLYSSDELREMELEILRNNHVYTHSYYLGRQTLRHLLRYEVENSTSWPSQIHALVRIADWDLMFGHHGQALEIYAQAYEELQKKGTAQAAIDEIFLPATPAVLPTFMPNPLASDTTEKPAGYIDVSFTVTKFGRSRNIQIVDATTDDADATKEDQLVNLIRRNRFRPRMIGGEFADTLPVVMRYYFRE